jgi:hypothetical protein
MKVLDYRLRVLGRTSYEVVGAVLIGIGLCLFLCDWIPFIPKAFAWQQSDTLFRGVRRIDLFFFVVESRTAYVSFWVITFRFWSTGTIVVFVGMMMLVKGLKERRLPRL